MDELFSNPIWVNVVNAVLLIAVGVFGTKVSKAKSKFKDALDFGKSLYEAAKDNKLDQDEVKNIKEKWNELAGNDETKKVN